MKLKAPCQALSFIAYDIDNNRIHLSDYIGKPVILSFFRDVSSPFCQLRVDKYSQRRKQWSELGIKVITVFSSQPRDARGSVAKHPTQFTTICDPELEIYARYGVEQSTQGVIKALIFKMPQLLAGLAKGGRFRNSMSNGKNIIPADFMIGPNGRIIDLWYGKDASDHIPMKRIESFVNKVKVARKEHERHIEVQALIKESAKVERQLIAALNKSTSTMSSPESAQQLSIQ